MSDNERDFKGVWIPKIVWLDERLNALDKVILTEIDSLDCGERGCYASNKHIADFCQCSESKVSKAISKLIGLGYLYIQNFDGRQRELKSRLTNSELENYKAESENLQGCIVKNAKQNMKNYKAESENLQESNTDNNTINNTIRKKKVSKTNGFDEIISEYACKFEGAVKDEVLDLLKEWLKVRKAKRAAMTDRAIQMNIEKLEGLAQKSEMTIIEYLKEVICRGWAAFYEIKNFNTKENSNNGQNTGNNGSTDVEGWNIDPKYTL